MEDWYSVTATAVDENGGGVLYQFGHSLSAALSAAYPEHKWQFWKLHSVPEGYWEQQENLVNFVEWLGDKLEIKRMEDWHRVSLAQIAKLASLTVVKKTGGLFELLKTVYPNHHWDRTSSKRVVAAVAKVALRGRIRCHLKRNFA